MALFFSLPLFLWYLADSISKTPDIASSLIDIKNYTTAHYILLAKIIAFITIPIFILPLLISKRDAKLIRYKLSRLCFGNQHFKFDGSMTKLFFKCLLCLILLIPTIGLSWFWYRSALAHFRYNNLSLEAIRLKTVVTGWRLCKFHLGNWFILIFTLGLGRPIVFNRRMKFFANNVLVVGDIEKSNIFQNQSDLPTTGEGFVSLFDLDIGFF